MQRNYRLNAPHLTLHLRSGDVIGIWLTADGRWDAWSLSAEDFDACPPETDWWRCDRIRQIFSLLSRWLEIDTSHGGSCDEGVCDAR